MTATADRPLLDLLPAPQAAVTRRLAAAFAAAGEELFLVGGIVRDAFLGRPLTSYDLDFATSALPDRTQALGLAAGAASAYDVGARFGTIGLVFEGVQGDEGDETGPPIVVEITTYRREHYPDATRHPEVALGGSLADDLARRDFTVNAVAADPATGALVDPFGGRADLDLAVLRAVGDPDARFAEDPLRLLRAARFVAQLGFRLDPATHQAMTRRAPDLARISVERVAAELTRLLTGPYAPDALETLWQTHLLDAALPELVPLAQARQGWDIGRHGREKDLWAHTRLVVGRVEPRPVLRWAALLHDAAKPKTRTVDARGQVHFFGHEAEGAKLAAHLLRRLKLDRATGDAVARIVELHSRPETYEPTWTDSAVRRLGLEATDPTDVLDDLLALAAADVTSARPHRQEAAAARVAALRAHLARLDAEHALAQLQSPLDGDELMARFGRGPGIWIKRVKEHLRDLVIDGALAPDDKETADRIARAMVESGEADAAPPAPSRDRASAGAPATQ